MAEYTIYNAFDLQKPIGKLIVPDGAAHHLALETMRLAVAVTHDDNKPKLQYLGLVPNIEPVVWEPTTWHMDSLGGVSMVHDKNARQLFVRKRSE